MPFGQRSHCACAEALRPDHRSAGATEVGQDFIAYQGGGGCHMAGALVFAHTPRRPRSPPRLLPGGTWPILGLPAARDITAALSVHNKRAGWGAWCRKHSPCNPQLQNHPFHGAVDCTGVRCLIADSPRAVALRCAAGVNTLAEAEIDRHRCERFARATP
jgi:hypothetical protein